MKLLNWLFYIGISSAIVSTTLVIIKMVIGKYSISFMVMLLIIMLGSVLLVNLINVLSYIKHKRVINKFSNNLTRKINRMSNEKITKITHPIKSLYKKGDYEISDGDTWVVVDVTEDGEITKILWTKDIISYNVYELNEIGIATQKLEYEFSLEDKEVTK